VLCQHSHIDHLSVCATGVRACASESRRWLRYCVRRTDDDLAGGLTQRGVEVLAEIGCRGERFAVAKYGIQAPWYYAARGLCPDELLWWPTGFARLAEPCRRELMAPPRQWGEALPAMTFCQGAPRDPPRPTWLLAGLIRAAGLPPSSSYVGA
jgi:hypothetical protein